jgi:hypothetical protein
MGWRLIVVAAVCVARGGVEAQSESNGDVPLGIVNFGVAAGMLSVKTVDDARSGSIWEIRSSRQVRASLDRNVSPTTTLGLTLAYAPLTMSYKRVRFAGEGPGGCNNGCDAEADLWKLGATVRVISGPGFHHILELTAGVSQYSDFREKTTGARLAPRASDRDFATTVGYGFGWSAGRALDLSLVGDVGFALHGRSGTDFPKTDVTWLGGVRFVVRGGL